MYIETIFYVCDSEWIKILFISLTKWFWNCISDVTSIMRNSVFSAALASNVSAISVPCGVEQWVFLTISCYCTDTTHCKWYGTYICVNTIYSLHNAWHFNPHNSISQLGIRVFQSHDVSGLDDSYVLLWFAKKLLAEVRPNWLANTAPCQAVLIQSKPFCHCAAFLDRSLSSSHIVSFYPGV